MNLVIVSEAPTPHNNFLFGELARESSINISFYYVYDAKTVPQRPWSTVSDKIGSTETYAGLGSWPSFSLLTRAFKAGPDTAFLLIGWNHALLYTVIVLLGTLRKPFVLWSDTPEWSADAPKSVRYYVRSFFLYCWRRSGGAFLVTGKEAGRRYQAIGVDPRRMLRLPFFIPPSSGKDPGMSRLNLRARHNVEQSLFLLSAGRLIHSKGFDLLIDALSQIDPMSGWKLILIGSGPENEALRAQVLRKGLENLVEFVPWVEPESLARYIEACDIFLAPARFDPFPTTIIQALSLGRCVIASDAVYSAVDFIDNGRNGYLFNANNSKDLSDMLRDVISDPARLESIGQAARMKMAEWPVSRGVAIIRDAVSRTVGG